MGEEWSSLIHGYITISALAYEDFSFSSANLEFNKIDDDHITGAYIRLINKKEKALNILGSVHLQLLHVLVKCE